MFFSSCPCRTPSRCSLLPTFLGYFLRIFSAVDPNRGCSHTTQQHDTDHKKRYVPVKHKDTGKYELVLIAELDELKRKGLVATERGIDVYVDPK